MPHIYRRLSWSKIWHFCRDCLYWPPEHFIESAVPSNPDDLCRIRELKHDRDKCDRVVRTRGGDRPAQVQQSVQFHGGLGGAEVGPGEEGQAQVDGTGVQGVDGVGESDIERGVRVERPRTRHQALAEVGVDPPVAALVRAGQRREPDRTVDPAMVELGGLGGEAGRAESKGSRMMRK